MKNIYRAGLIFYAVGLACIAIQQFFYKDLRPVIAPEDWPSWLHATPFWAFFTGIILLISCVLLILGIKTRIVAIFLSSLLFLFFIVLHVPYRLFVSADLPRHVAVWTNALKELTFSGGALIIAGSSLKNNFSGVDERYIRKGRIFFSITMIVFGYAHFLYPDFVSTLVPSWIPWPYFWTYFAGVALIGSGLGIMLKIRISLVARLTGIMIFIWFIVLHIPRAIADPYGAKGNEVTSVFEALAFSGIAFMIAAIYSIPVLHIKKVA